MATRKATTKMVGETARIHGALIALLRKAGCTFCPGCYCYMPPTHKCAGAALLFGPPLVVVDCHALPKAA